MPVNIRKFIGTDVFMFVNSTTTPTNFETKRYVYFFTDGNLVECKNKTEAIELLRKEGITDLHNIDFPVVKKQRDSRYILFVKKWARIFLKTDASQWNDVGDSIEIEYNQRIKKDAKFRKDAESSSMTLSQEVAYWTDIIGRTQSKK